MPRGYEMLVPLFTKTFASQAGVEALDAHPVERRMAVRIQRNASIELCLPRLAPFMFLLYLKKAVVVEQ